MTLLVGLWVALVAGAAWRWRPPPRRILTAATKMPRPGTPGAATTPAVATAVAPSATTPAAASAATPAGRPPRTRLVAVALVAVAVVLALIWPPLALVVGGAALIVPPVRRRHHERQRRRAIRRQLPDVVDLLVVAVSAGLTPALAIGHLATLAPEPFGAAFADTGRRMRRGQRLADALDALPAQLGEAARPVAHTLASAERYGTPVGPALELLAHDARLERRRLAEEAARTVPVKLCCPLVCCTLPAFVLLTIAPLVAGALRSLRL
jgi:pilus assembly protein TadC